MEARLAEARGYSICVQCFPNDNFVIGLQRLLRTPFSHVYHRIIQEIYLIVSIPNYVSISTAFFIKFIYLLPKDNLKNTHKTYIFAILCLLSSRFISKNVSAFYSAQLQR